MLFEFNEICLTNNEPPALSPLFKQHPNQKIGPMQSDILKVIVIELYFYFKYLCIKLCILKIFSNFYNWLVKILMKILFSN